MIWSWSYTLEILPVLARAAIVTIEATVLSFVIALVLGLVLAVLRMSGPVVGWLAFPLNQFIWPRKTERSCCLHWTMRWIV